MTSEGLVEMFEGDFADMWLATHRINAFFYEYTRTFI